MKKLNNRGFAISTMLYGILTMVLLILTLLLTIMQSSYNKENAAVENITYYLNKCMAKQVAVEECFKTYNADPANPISCYDEYEAYTSCLGNNSIIQSTNQSERLSQKAIADATGTSSFVEDENMSGRYIYVGTNPNNYVKYGNKLARIISIETDGSVKLILDEEYNNLKFDVEADITANNGRNAWQNSALIAVLKNKTSTISYSDMFIQGKFYTGTITESMTPKSATETILSEEYENNTYKTGVISAYDYAKASSDSSCNINSTSGTFLEMLANCKNSNWITTYNNGCSWTTTAIISSGKIDKYITIDKNQTNKYSLTDPNVQCNARLVFYLSNDTLVDKKGIGSSTNPYIVVF